MKNIKQISWHSKIKTKVISLLIVTITMVMIIAGFLSYNYIKTNETERLTEFAQTTVERLAESLVSSMWNVDRLQVNELVETELNERTILGIIVNDEGNRGVFSSKKRNSLGNIIDFKGSFKDDDIRVNRDIVKDSKVIGSIELSITKEYLNQELTKFAVSAIVLVIILLFVIFLLMNYLLSKIVINPLLELANITKAISSGQLDQNLKIKSKDEIGYLAESFRKMQRSLLILMRSNVT